MRVDESKMMEIDPPQNFPTKDDEIKYWMEMAYEMSQRNETTMHELQEYQENSQYVEKELELSFLESDQKNRTLGQENCRLIASNDELRRRLSEQVAANVALRTEMQKQREKFDELVVNVRNLEQKNDDLERDNRALKVMQEDMESQYNDALEKIALLETDLLDEGYARFDMDRLEKENGELKKRIEILLEESKSVVLRTRNEINQVRLTAQQRSSYNMACTPYNIITERHREPEAEIIVTDAEINNNLVTSSPIKIKDAPPAIPQLRAIQAARKQKYNTEGRGLSQVFAQYNKQLEERGSLDRSIEVRSKKIKDEEKRQRLLSSFVKRIRNARNQLLRRND